MTTVLNFRDNKQFKISNIELIKLEDFYIKNIVEDCNDDSNICINEDYDIVKNIFDSMRYQILIFNESTNLRLMLQVCNKWCVQKWLIKSIEQEIVLSKKLTQLNNYTDEMTNCIYQCKLCKVGFNKYNNKIDSCKTHRFDRTISGSTKYACCNKEEPCIIGYHVIDIMNIMITHDRMKDIL
jgi:hypothetical protein